MQHYDNSNNNNKVHSNNKTITENTCQPTDIHPVNRGGRKTTSVSILTTEFSETFHIWTITVDILPRNFKPVAQKWSDDQGMSNLVAKLFTRISACKSYTHGVEFACYYLHALACRFFHSRVNCAQYGGFTCMIRTCNAAILAASS